MSENKPIEVNELILFDELLNRVGKNLPEIRSILISDKVDENGFYKLKEYIRGYIKQMENDKNFATKIGFDYNEYVDEFTTKIFGLGLIQNYIENSTIQEIVFEPLKVYVKRNDKLELTPLKFKNYENLMHKLLTVFNVTKQANIHVDVSMDFSNKDMKIVIKKI